MVAELLAVLPFILLGALLYTSVGHGGATVYLAVLTLAGYHVSALVPTVLVLNILAATIAFVNFHQAGHLRPRLLLPFLVASVPFAYVGGSIALTLRALELILGVALLAAAARLLLLPRPPRTHVVSRDSKAFYVAAPILGAILGFLAGATGIGGGIFLSPILLVLGWADIRESASVASAFIVINSISGLTARITTTPVDWMLLAPMALVVLLGALAGSHLGARRLTPRILQAALGLVLVVAGGKALFM